MEITKIYSDPWEEGGRKYYSVLLTEDELRMFADSDYLADTLSNDQLRKMDVFQLKAAMKRDREKATKNRNFHRIGAAATGAALLGGRAAYLVHKAKNAGGKVGPGVAALAILGDAALGGLGGLGIGDIVGRSLHPSGSKKNCKLQSRYIVAHSKRER